MKQDLHLILFSHVNPVQTDPRIGLKTRSLTSSTLPLPVEISGFSHFFGFEGPDQPWAGVWKSTNT